MTPDVYARTAVIRPAQKNSPDNCLTGIGDCFYG